MSMMSYEVSEAWEIILECGRLGELETVQLSGNQLAPNLAGHLFYLSR